MNTKTTILLGALFLSLLSCDRAADKLQIETEVSLCVDVGNQLTKTWLDDSSSDQSPVPVYWSDGDIINVNGRNSAPISVAQGERKSEAEFKVRGISAPYSIVYPASVCGSNAYVDGKIRVTLPSVQQYDPNSFANGAALTCAYVSDESEDVYMTNLCALVKIGVVDDESSVIKKVFIVSDGEDCPISGIFDLNPQEVSLTSVEGDNEIELELPAPVQLGSQAKNFYITLPAGEYPEGFSIYFVREDGRRMKCNWRRPNPAVVKGLTLAPSSMVCFKDVEFVPGAKAIESEADWNSFAAAMNSGEGQNVWLEEGRAWLGNDITFASNPTQISEFEHILDGCGHTLTVSAASGPLFSTLTGGVRNLVLAGNLNVSQGPMAAPLANTLSDGTVENCINRMTVTFNGASDIALSGLVAKAEGGQILNCVNEANVSQTVDGTSVFDVCCGGLVATAGGNLIIKDSDNKGQISVDFKGTKRPTFAGFGGLVGRITDGSKDEGYVCLDSCSNISAIEVKYSDISSGGGWHGVSVGGIVGIAALYSDEYKDNSGAMGVGVKDPTASDYEGIYTEIENCVNEGKVSNETITNVDSKVLNMKIFTGGIAGSLVGASEGCHSVVRNCVSMGDVVPYSGTYSRSAFSSVCGGIAGIAGFVDIEGSTVNATVGTYKKHSFATGGIAGLCLTAFKFDKCKVKAAINMIQATGYTGAMVLGTSVLSKVSSNTASPAPKVSGSEIKNCGFGGSVNTATVAYNAAVPSAVLTNIDADTFDKYILGGNYTGKDITVSGNYYWNGF